jgi:hypothetical protein
VEVNQVKIDVERAGRGTRCIVGLKIEGPGSLLTALGEEEAKRVDMCP